MARPSQQDLIRKGAVSDLLSAVLKGGVGDLKEHSSHKTLHIVHTAVMKTTTTTTLLFEYTVPHASTLTTPSLDATKQPQFLLS